MSIRRISSYLALVFLAVTLIWVLAGSKLSSQAVPPQETVISGRNVNMVSGDVLPGGDPWLQRQNEPSIAVSSRNPLHLLAGANDYRTVDMPTSEGELPGKQPTAAVGDAWLGVFMSYDGGESWTSTMLPGFPQDPLLGNPLKAYRAAADPVVRSGPNGLFYFSGIAFNRTDNIGVVFVARFIDDNNKEGGGSIRYIDTKIIAKGTATKFLDKPWISVDQPRLPAGNITISGQTFPRHNVYLAYSAFTGTTNTVGDIMFSRSADCGTTWGAPIKISSGSYAHQGATIAIKPVVGEVLVAWRRFGVSGRTPDSIFVAQSLSRGLNFQSPVKVADVAPFDQPTTDETQALPGTRAGFAFRTNSYPTMTADKSGHVYLAWAQRGAGTGGGARVVLSSSYFGSNWSVPQAVANLDENGLPFLGHQLMPSLSFAAGKLILVWYDQRHDVSSVQYGFNSWILDDLPFRHTMDVWAAEADTSTFPTLSWKSSQVSRYLHAMLQDGNGDLVYTSDGDPIVFPVQFNCVNYPLFKGGHNPFNGDYIDVAAAPTFKQDTWRNWIFNTDGPEQPVFHVAWTDNRDVRPPSNNNWTLYTPPVSTQGSAYISPERPGCNPYGSGNEPGMRNQNIYTSRVTWGIEAGSPVNDKPLNLPGGTARAFVVFVKNNTEMLRGYRLTIAAQPVGGQASFEQFSLLATLDVEIAAFSTMSRPIFIRSTDINAAVTVNINEIDASGAVIVNGLTSSILINGDTSNPQMSGNEETHNPNIVNAANPNIVNWYVNPNIVNPNIRNPNIRNPNIVNPNIVNPNIRNPNIVNPNIVNPNIVNPNIVNPNIVNRDVANPNIVNPNIVNPNIVNPNIRNATPEDVTATDVEWTVKNEGTTTTSYTLKTLAKMAPPEGVYVQLLVYRVHYTPAVAGAELSGEVGNACLLKQEPHHELILSVVNPNIVNPNIVNPNIVNPNIRNASIENATFSVAPGEEVVVDLRVLDSGVSTTSGLKAANAMAPGSAAPQAFSVQDFIQSLGFAVTSQAVNSTAAAQGNQVPPADATDLVIGTSSLPDGVAGYSYNATLNAYGGTGSYSWSLNAGELPTGLSLGGTGLIGGVPTVAGTFQFIVRVDAGGQFDTQQYSIVIDSDTVPDTLNVVTTALPNGVQGHWYGAALEAVGGVYPRSWSLASGTLPDGLSLDSGGVISGTPTTEGTSIFSVRVADRNGTIAVRLLSIDIAAETSIYFSISGTIYNETNGLPLAGVVLRGLPNTPVTGADGSYTEQVPAGWTGTAIPFMAGHTFSPESLPYTTVGSPQTGQDYNLGFAAPIISGTVTLVGGTPLAGVVMTGLTGNPTTDLAGYYAATVTRPWTGTVTPALAGYTFTPPSKMYVGVTTAQITNYVATPVGPLANKLAFTQNPSGGIGGSTWAAQPKVEIQDADGNRIHGDNSTIITLAISADPGGGMLSGVVEAQVIDGEATFAGLSIDRGGLGYILLASTVPPITLAPAASAAFNIEGFSDRASMSTGRQFHTATFLDTDKILIAGGMNSLGYLRSAELYDPAANTFTPLGEMNDFRGEHTATPLLDGKTLIAGGGNLASTAELFDPAEGTFSWTGNMTYNRDRHAATRLQDGRVLITGGSPHFANTAEIYDPITGTFSLTGAMNEERTGHTSTWLPNGKVLITGGGAYISSAELFDPATGIFTSIGNMAGGARFDHTASLLNDGTVLITGGTCNAGDRDTAEIFSPASNTFTNVGSMLGTHSRHNATLLRDGTVLIVGDGDPEIYNPLTQTFHLTGPAYIASSPGNAAATTKDGWVFVTGGEGEGAMSGTEMWNPLVPFPTHVISGHVTHLGAGVPGVLMDGFPGYPVTDYGGYYEAVVMDGWTGSVTPTKAGYSFTPAFRDYSTAVATDLEDQDFAAYQMTFTLIYTPGAGGSITGTTPQTVEQGANGTLVTAVPDLNYHFVSWSDGILTPARTDTNVTASIAVTATFAIDTFTITGAVTAGGSGLGNVIMNGLPGNPTSNGSGAYTATVDYGFTATVTPTLAGYTFAPANISYTNVSANQIQDYTAIRLTFTISGIVTTGGIPLMGVSMSGLPGNPVTNDLGDYKVTVDYGFTATVTPTLAGYSFAPLSRSYTNVSSDQPVQDYAAMRLTYTISGTVTAGGSGLGNVIMNGLPGNPTTNGSGAYTATVDYGFTATVTPTLAGYTFAPANFSYTNVTANQIQAFTATPLTYTISGIVTTGGIPLMGVSMSGLPGSPATNASGQYTATVDHGWSGTATPTLDGYAFSPAARSYSDITADQPSHDYTATAVPSGSERAALIALYNSTNGDSWTNKAGWKTPPLHSDGFAMPGTEGTWYGITVTSSHVTRIALSSNNLNGILPYQIGGLVNVQRLNLGGNHLTGGMPAQIGNLANLQNLELNYNFLEGNIPPEIGNLTNLRSFYVYSNKLTGIPSQIVNLTNLQELNVGHNLLSGSIPSFLGNLANLRLLSLAFNELTGALPLELFDLANLASLELENNQLTGPIPIQLGNLTNLTGLYLNSNQFSGSIPSSLGMLTSLAHLSLNNNRLIGSIPPGIGNCTELREVYLQGNLLTGSIPVEIGNLTKATYLYLASNLLSGNIPSQLGLMSSVYFIHLYSNQLTGTIPGELGSLPHLNELFLSNNQLSGNIPSQLGSAPNLQRLTVNNNNLLGSIPGSLANLTGLNQLDIGYNGLYTNDSALLTFLTAKDPDWANTQTVAPANVVAAPVGPSSVSVSWTPILYTGDTGGYRVSWSTTPGGPYTFFNQTASKSINSLAVDTLNPGVTYYFVVQTRTNPHGSQQNMIDSENGNEATSTTSAFILTYSAGTGGMILGSTSQTVNHGQNGSEVTAVPDPGYHFVSWSDSILTPARTDTNVTANISVTASFAIDSFTLLVTATHGLVEKLPDQPTYDDGTPVELTATPAEGYHFVEWLGDATGGENPITITMDSNKSVTAVFALTTYTISGTVTAGGLPLENVVMNGLPGSVVTNASGAYTATVGEFWSETVTPSLAGYTFVPANKVYTEVSFNETQNYAAARYQVTISGGISADSVPLAGVELQISTGGSVTTGSDGRYSFIQWSGWSGALTPVKAGHVFAPPSQSYTNVIADQAGQDYSASLITFTLEYFAGEHGSISGITPQTVAYGGSGTQVIAVPDEGYHNSGWNDQPSWPAARTDTNVVSNISVTANFAINRYALTISKTGTPTGLVASNPDGIDCGTTCAAWFEHGTVVTLTATPIIGSGFTSWTGADVPPGQETANPLTITMSASKSLTANFIAYTPVQITTTSIPSGARLKNNTSVHYQTTLTATGGLAPFTWSIASGTLPSGLTLESDSGILKGNPTEAGDFTFTAQVRDSVMQIATQQLTFVIADWIGAFHNNINDKAFAITADAAGYVYPTGTGHYNNSPSYMTFKYAASGALLYEAFYNGPSGTDEAYAVALDALGNSYVTGKGPGIGTGDDIATIKYNSAGVEQWVRRYDSGASHFDAGFAIAVDASGNAYVAAVTNDVYGSVIKYDSQGTQLWIQSWLHGNGQTWSFKQSGDIAVDSDGNVIVATSYKYGADDSRWNVIKYDTSGNFLWEKFYEPLSSVESSMARAVVFDAAGNAYVTGSRYTSSVKGVQMTTIKYNPSGVESWIKAIDTSYGYAIDLDINGNVYSAGQIYHSSNFDFGLVKYDAAGNEQWTRTYNSGGTAVDLAIAIAVDALGNAYLTGQGAYGTVDYTTAKWNAFGVLQWIAKYNGSGNSTDYATDLTLDPTGNLYVTGYSNEGTGRGYDFTTIKYSQSFPVTLMITTPWLDSGYAGIAYAKALWPFGGGGTRTWSLIGGSLPSGLALGASTGVIAGMPSSPGIYGFTVQVDDGGLTATKAYTLTISPGAATKIQVETAADGLGTIVPAQNVSSGSSITVYAIARDASDTFIGNVAADSWSLENLSGGVVSGDLMHSEDLKSALFIGGLIGSANIRATKSGWASTDSGRISVVAAAATKIQVETAANGSGTVVPAQDLTSGKSITVYAVSRDAGDNFIENVAADSWSLANKTGGVVDGDLIPSGDMKSANFTGHSLGSANIHPAKSGYTSVDSGVMTVVSAEEWVARYNGPANVNDDARAMTVDSWGNTYVTGISTGVGIAYDYATVKYNSAGVQQWVARYNGPGNGADHGLAIAVDGLLNVYVTGRSVGTGTELDYATIKYNSSGVQQWVARYNGPANNADEASAIAVDSSGYVYVTGSSADADDMKDSVTVKYDSSGVEQWVARFNGTANYDDQACAIAIDSLGNVHVTGFSIGSSTSTDYATIKYDSSGVEKWVARYNGPGNATDEGRAIAIDSAGNVYITGNSFGSGSGQDYATIKYNNLGIEQWVARYNGPGNGMDIGSAIRVDPLGNEYISGTSEASASGQDYATIKYDSSGIEQWAVRYNGPGNGAEGAYVNGIDPWGNIYVTGVSLGSGTGNDYATLKYSQSFPSTLIITTDTLDNGYVGTPYAKALWAFGGGGRVWLLSAGTLPPGMEFSSSGIISGTPTTTGTYNFTVQVISGSLNATKALAITIQSEIYEFVLKWGSTGSGDGQFSVPEGVAVDSSGFVYATDNGNERIQKFDSSGNFVTKWGSSGSGNGQFNSPYGIAVDNSGYIYVADQGNHRIQKFDSSGNFVTKWGSSGIGNGQFDILYGIAVDGSGYVYVADHRNYRIQKFDSSGNFVTKWGSSGSEDGQFSVPIGVAVDSSGFVYVADMGHVYIQKFDSSGNFVTKWGSRGSGDGQFTEVYGIAVDSSGFVFVLDSRRVQKFDSSGNFVTKWGSSGSGDGQFNNPMGIAVNSSRYVYVTDERSNRIQVFRKK